MYSLLSVALGKFTLHTSLKLKQIISRFQAHLQLLDTFRQLCKIQHKQTCLLQALVFSQTLPPLGPRADQLYSVTVYREVMAHLSPQDISP